jgi:hypothetical protein
MPTYLFTYILLLGLKEARLYLIFAPNQPPNNMDELALKLTQ